MVALRGDADLRGLDAIDVPGESSSMTSAKILSTG